MVSQSKKSKKRSATKAGASPPEEIFFIDRNLGKAFLSRLQQEGLHLQPHESVFPTSQGGEHVADSEWIERAATEGWLAVTHDNNVTRDPIARAAIASHLGRVLVVRGTMPQVELASMLIKALPRIRRFAAQRSAPWLARVHQVTRRNGEIDVEVTAVE